MNEDSTLSAETKARLDAAMAAHPEKFYAVAHTMAGDLVLCSPTRQNYLLYRSMLLDEAPQTRAQAAGTILAACACDPEPMALRTMLDRYPALDAHPAVQKAIQQVCGLAEGAYAKK
jgi:hypothetical protein